MFMLRVRLMLVFHNLVLSDHGSWTRALLIIFLVTYHLCLILFIHNLFLLLLWPIGSKQNQKGLEKPNNKMQGLHHPKNATEHGIQ
uniref:Putative ovule protein n=1 Tax=Solanum chacoense TaxID=4108 RepID=A0A0V0H7M0_SOLCH